MTKRAKDPAVATAEALSTIAGNLGGKIAAGSSLRGTVPIDAGTLEVEITMVVRHRPTAEARVDHLTNAMILFVTEPWRDRCQHYIKGRRRGSFSPSGSCRIRPTHVSVCKTFDGSDTIYAFCCATHAKSEIGSTVLAVIKIPKARIEKARTEITARRELKAKLEKMTPEERIAEDAKGVSRHAEAVAILAGERDPPAVMTPSPYTPVSAKLFDSQARRTG